MPPTPNVVTFYDYFKSLWKQTIGKYVFHHKAKHIYIVIDKPSFLPPPRSIVHKSRASRTTQDVIVDPVISDESQIPHGSAYSSILACKSASFKSELIKYITSQFLDEATSTTSNYDFNVTLDSPASDYGTQWVQIRAFRK